MPKRERLVKRFDGPKKSRPMEVLMLKECI
jgi:hypothetical protein